MYCDTKHLRIHQPTQDEILNKISEYQIFCDCLRFKPTVGKLYNSPLRVDPRPSFGLFYGRNGKLLYKDLGDGDSGNCFKLYSKLEGITIPEAMRRISGDIKPDVKKIANPVRDSKEKDIAVEEIMFSQESLKWWASFGITLETLNKFKVSEIKSIWVNGEKVAQIRRNKPGYAYFIYDKVKTYEPFNNARRFLTNCTSFDLQGWEQLDYSKDTVIITKSMKDVMTLYELGYTAIAVGGEGHNLPDAVITELKSKFKNIVIFFDFDNAGVRATRRLSKQQKEFGFIFTSDRKAKDISDYHRSYGREETIKLLSKKVKYAEQHHRRV